MSLQNINLEKIQCSENEINTVVDIWYQASIKCHDFVDESFWYSNKNSMRDIYIPASETTVAKCQGKVVGFVSLVDDLLAAIFILPEYQGRGIGRELLFDAFSRRKKLALNVYEKNHTARDFYLKYGFMEEQRGIDEQTGEIEITMKWNVDTSGLTVR